MKKVFILFILSSILTFMYSQESTVSVNGIISSSILKEEMHYSIYLPAGYNTSERDYPVVYLLHGRTDDHTAWIRFGEMQRITDKGIKDGTITPMIIVMPDAKLTFYMNDVNSNYRYEDYFFKELIPYIEQHYRCSRTKENRAVAGLSMGGYGSLLYSLHHPEMFAACAALSAGVRTDDDIINMPDNQYRDTYGKLFGLPADPEKRISDYYNKNSVLFLIKNLPSEQVKSVKYWLDCGDDDFLYKGNTALHVLMRDLQIPHEYRVRDGIHEWEYWRTGLPDALKFISQSFHR